MDREQRKKILTNVRYYHFNVVGGGAITIVVHKDSISGPYASFYVGIAFCSSEDKFQKAKGRNQALRNLAESLKNGNHVYLKHTFLPDKFSMDCINFSITSYPWKPRWFCKVYNGRMITEVITPRVSKRVQRRLTEKEAQKS